MRLRVVAVDYDGTIARDGILEASVREAIRQARKRGVFVVIATGRILSELREVSGGLDFVDGVVAENGAVFALPNGYTSMLADPPPVSLLAKLNERNIEFKVGRCVVEMDADLAEVAMALIRELELPLAITFNRGRMMLLPASISKSYGLRELLNILGLSVHNAIGIGDAENDHDLLSVCEYGVAVEWGSPLLKEHADHIITGHGPEAVGEYIKQLSTQVRLPSSTRGRRKIVLEAMEGHPPFEIAIRGRNILVAGDTQSGKSWLAGLLCEQMILKGYTVYVFDPEGDYASLRSLPNTVVLGGGNMLPHDDDLTMLLHQGLSVVLNLAHLGQEEKSDYIHHHLRLVAQFRRRHGYPHRILVDECHYFLNWPGHESLLDEELDSYTLVTYLPSLLAPEILATIDVVAVTRLAQKQEVDTIQRLAGADYSSADWYGTLANLGITEAALLPPTAEAGGELRRFCVAPRFTQHVRHRTKYYDIPVVGGSAFVFTDEGSPLPKSAATLGELVSNVKLVAPHVLQGHLQRHDLSNWIAGLFGDHELACAVRKLESRHQPTGTVDEFADALAAEIKRRYECAE